MSALVEGSEQQLNGCVSNELVGAGLAPAQGNQLFLNFDFTFMLSDFQVDGKRVTFNHKMILDDTRAVIEECADEVIVEGGKIKSSRMTTCKYP